MSKSPSKKTPVASFKCSLSYSGSLSRPIKDIMRATDRQTDIRREWEVSLPINEENPFKSHFSICLLIYLQEIECQGEKGSIPSPPKKRKKSVRPRNVA